MTRRPSGIRKMVKKMVTLYVTTPKDFSFHSTQQLELLISIEYFDQPKRGIDDQKESEANANADG